MKSANALALAVVWVFMACLAALAQEAPGPKKRVTGAELQQMLQEKVAKGEVFLLDVREPEELEQLGTLEGYVNVPLGELAKRLNELPKDKAILTA